MKISVKNAGKRFNHEWIFRHFNYEFLPGNKYAITGANGSGKSTLLQVIAGAAMASEGEIIYATDTGSLIPDTGYQMPDTKNQKPDTGYQNPGSAHSALQSETTNERNAATTIKPHPASGIRYPASIQHPYKHLSFTAPYLELIEEMTATEFLSFHSKFKKLSTDINTILSETGLLNAAAKQIRYFSSGMKQRLKLAQGLFCETPVMLLDEPTTNLDADGTHLYHYLIEKYTTGKLVIISSNSEEEYNFCTQIIRMKDYK